MLRAHRSGTPLRAALLAFAAAAAVVAATGAAVSAPQASTAAAASSARAIATVPATPSGTRSTPAVASPAATAPAPTPATATPAPATAPAATTPSPAAATAPAAAASTPSGGSYSAASSSDPTDAQKTAIVFAQTNEVRAEADTTPLVRNAALDKVAQNWAYQQWKNGAMSHNPNYSQQIPAGWTHAGENVAAGYTYDEVVPAWVNSPEHYRNLVGDYTDIGIGYYEGPDGYRYWVQEFAKYPTTKVPPKQAPSFNAIDATVPSGSFSAG